MGSLLLFSAFRMKPCHGGPLTLENRPTGSSADGANYGEAVGWWFPAMVVCSDNPGCQTNGDRTQTLTLSIYVLFSFASHGTSHVGFAALHR
jgi:hypothetical protein